MSTLNSKKKDVAHLKNWKLHFQLGTVCKKIHRIWTRKIQHVKVHWREGKKISKKSAIAAIKRPIRTIGIIWKWSRASFSRATASISYKNPIVVTTSYFAEEIVHNKPYSAGFTILLYSSCLIFTLTSSLSSVREIVWNFVWLKRIVLSFTK